MTTFETVYLMNEAANLIGQGMFDVITVVFTIIAAGLFGAARLTRTLVIGIAVLSALWVVPMLFLSFDQMLLTRTLALTLRAEDLAELSGLARIIGENSMLTVTPMALAIVVTHGLTWLGAIWFLFDSHKRAQQAA